MYTHHLFRQGSYCGYSPSPVVMLHACSMTHTGLPYSNLLFSIFSAMHIVFLIWRMLSWLHAGTGKSRNLQPLPDHHLPNSSCWVGTCPDQWVQSPLIKELNPTASCSSTVDILAICCGKKCHECNGEGFLACFTCEGKATSYSPPDANHTATSRPPSPENTLRVEWAHDDCSVGTTNPHEKTEPNSFTFVYCWPGWRISEIELKHCQVYETVANKRPVRTDYK